MWAFVTGRLELEDFESFVYDRMESLESLFTSEGAAALVELDYRTVTPESLRRDIKLVIQCIPLECECAKIPPALEMDVGFLACVDGSAALIEYVHEHVERSFCLVRTDAALSGYWRRQFPEYAGPQVFLHEGSIYRCHRCERSWLVMLDETTLAYVFLQLTADEANRAGTAQLEERLRDALGFQRCKR